MLPPDNTAHPQRSIRSFVLRAGRMGSGQEKALAELGPQFLLPWQAQPLNLDAAFGRTAPRIVEIGFGMGQATAEIAAQRPEDDFLGIEVHTPGVGALLKAIGERGLTNLRIVQHDAVEVLRNGIAPGSLAGIHIYFPDPWHKKRHHKRRLIQPDFVRLLTEKLRPGGYLHLATDWENYAEQMLAVLSAEPLLQNTVDGYAPRPAQETQETRKAALSVSSPLEGRSSQSDDYGVDICRPLTKFEARGLRLGHGVWDLLFSRAD